MWRWVTILGLVVGGVLLMPSAAVGECDGPFPSFQNAAPSARRIVIGQVVATLAGPPGFDDGRTSRFTLRGWSVLEGDKPVAIDVRDVQSQPCAGYIVARPGDRIAIAFEGHDFTPVQVVNAVAWLEGQPPSFDGIESTNVGAIYVLLGRVPSAAGPAPTPEPAVRPSIDGPIGAVVLLAILFLMGLVGSRWNRSAP